MDPCVLFELVEEVQQLSSVEEIHSFCAHLGTSLGFSGFLLAARVSTSFAEPQSAIISGFPTPWWEHYRQNSYIPQDPVVAYSIRHKLPLDWQTITNRHCDQAGLTVMQQARDFGLRSGLACPVHGSGGSLALLTFSSQQEHLQRRADMLHHMAYTHLLAAHLHEALLRTVEIRQLATTDTALSRREQECLLWGSEGKTAWEIAQILNIAERTVIYHFHNACQKLDVTTRQQAIARAISLGLITPQFS